MGGLNLNLYELVGSTAQLNRKSQYAPLLNFHKLYMDLIIYMEGKNMDEGQV